MSHLYTMYNSLMFHAPWILFPAIISVINSPVFAGIHEAMKLANTGQASDEVQDDMDGEQEGLPDVMPEDLVIATELESLQNTILNASKGVCSQCLQPATC